MGTTSFGLESGGLQDHFPYLSVFTLAYMPATGKQPGRKRVPKFFRLSTQKCGAHSLPLVEQNTTPMNFFKKPFFVFLLFSLFQLACRDSEGSAHRFEAEQEKAKYALVIHGGAGTIKPEKMDAQTRADYEKALHEALDRGEEVLRDGGTALDAVVASITYLEDSPLFNAGRGAVFTHEGYNELDASIMDGETHAAGAVGGVRKVRNPIMAARAVMEKSPHVLLTCAGADRFAVEQGLDTVPPSYFYTERRWQSLQRRLDKERKKQPVGETLEEQEHKFGTVGCVALDRYGNLAAGTSTGGMTNKRWNRLGDSPIIGAGTYADNASCAVSCTGHGEFFIREAVAHDMSARMLYLGETVEEAGAYIIRKKLKDLGGKGGLIALDRYGNIAMPFNTSGMYRGYARPNERMVAIFRAER